MDLPAEFYLETVERIFIDNDFGQSRLTHRGRLVSPEAIRRCAILAVEGENDDITGKGQTRALLDLATSLPASKKSYHLQPGVGHYGLFNGKRYRDEIVPEIVAFTKRHAAPAQSEGQPGDTGMRTGRKSKTATGA